MSENDKWPGGFESGQRVKGVYGEGMVATINYCWGIGPEFEGKTVEGTGIREGLIPVIFDDVGCFWQSKYQIKKVG